MAEASSHAKAAAPHPHMHRTETIGLIDTAWTSAVPSDETETARRLAMMPLRGGWKALRGRGGGFVIGQTLVADGGTLITDGHSTAPMDMTGDETMLKLLIAGRRTKGKTREAALAHLKRVHGPLVYDAPADAGAMPSRYVQNHVFDGPQIPALAAYLSDRDLVTEIWFENVGHLKAATQTPYCKDILQPDEGNFVDQASVLKVMVAESEASGVVPADAVKLFVFLKRGTDVSLETFERRHRAVFTGAIASDAPVSAFVMNAPLPPPAGGAPYADGIAEVWFAGRAAAERFCRATLAPALSADLGAALDTAASFYLLADAYPVARLRASAVA